MISFNHKNSKCACIVFMVKIFDKADFTLWDCLFGEVLTHFNPIWHFYIPWKRFRGYRNVTLD